MKVKRFIIAFYLLILLPVSLLSQGLTLKGKIIYAGDNQPLVGVTVVVKGTVTGTTSDVNGNYSLKNVGKDATLVFSFIGMETQEIAVKNQTTINVAMSEGAYQLKEVVAVGYGVQKKESVVGAVAQTTSKELMRTGNIPDFKQALTGQIPGLVTITSSGEPGGVRGQSATEIYIRGQNTWNGGQPLILIDGVERDMSNLEVSEVQSISVLKDASATAVFGVKGANGVILITTKRGEVGKTNITFSYSATGEMISKVPSMMDSYDAIQMRNLAIEREVPLNEPSWLDYIPYEISTRYRKPQTAEYARIYPNINWREAMFKDVGLSDKATLNISGGNKIVRYFGTLAYSHVGDMFRPYENNKTYDPNYNFDRFNFRSNIDFQLTKTTSLKLNLSGYYSQKNTNYNGQGSGDKDYLMWQAIYFMPPDVFLPQHPDGRWGWSTSVSNIYNPVSVVNNSGLLQRRTTELNADFILEQNLDFITKGLNAKAALSYDNNVTSQGGVFDSQNTVWPLYNTSNTPFVVINPNLYTGPDQDPNEYSTYYPIGGLYRYDWVQLPWTINAETISTGVYRRLNYQFQLNYARKFGLHNVGAMGVFTRDEYASGNEFRHYREDWVFRTTYDYDTRYLLEMNGAYNGSEQFGAGYRFDFFPSIGLGWNIYQEKFFKLPWMSQLKVRYTLGYVGDDRAAGSQRWLYSTRYSYGGNSLLSANISASPYNWYKELSVGNPDIHWENAKKQNYGLEVGVFENMLALNFEYFTENRTDILIAGNSRSIPDFFGATPPAANLGQVNSFGYEVELKFNKRFNDTRLWSTLSFSHNENEVKFKDDPILLPSYQKSEGYPIGQTRTLLETGFYNNWDEVYASVPTSTNDNYKMPGFYNLLDFNSDGIIDNYDNVPYAYSNIPQNTFSTSFGVEHKGFSAMVQFYGVSNASRMVSLMNFTSNTNVVFDHVYDYWSKDNQDATSFLPRWKTAGQNIGDYFLFDASYVRLKTAEIAYMFESSKNAWLKSLGVSSLKLYLSGNNLFIWTDLPDDREGSNLGGSASTGAYPAVKRINLGANLSF
ncbi:MAG: SusC/RagA family TonB-linked outer membrane protein [Paludibacter sp.]|nr:SusC/RagA family TonB-linked outer membrane protein [Paludibacter sp.]